MYFFEIYIVVGKEEFKIYIGYIKMFILCLRSFMWLGVLGGLGKDK